MKKTLFGFAAGAVLTLTLLKIAEVVTYTTNTFRFCLIGDLLVGAAVFVGIVIDRLELTAMANAEQAAEPAQPAKEPEQAAEPVEVPRILAKHEKKPAAEIDEVEPIPEMLDVGNDFVRRADQ